MKRKDGTEISPTTRRRVESSSVFLYIVEKTQLPYIHSSEENFTLNPKVRHRVREQGGNKITFFSSLSKNHRPMLPL